MTHTFALLDVSGPTYDEIEKLLRTAGYDHCFGHAQDAIDMHGIGLVRATPKENDMEKADSAKAAGSISGGTATSAFAGATDARQMDNTNAPVSRFRPTYRALTDDEKALHDAIKTKAAELETLFGKVKPGRYNSLAITALEQSVMWVVKELTS
jgi:hypothetical protein